jgi:hypothetical protein
MGDRHLLFWRLLTDIRRCAIFFTPRVFPNRQDNNHKNKLEMDQGQEFLLGLLTTSIGIEISVYYQRKIIVLSCCWKVDQRPFPTSFHFGGMAALTTQGNRPSIFNKWRIAFGRRSNRSLLLVQLLVLVCFGCKQHWHLSYSPWRYGARM